MDNKLCILCLEYPYEFIFKCNSKQCRYYICELCRNNFYKLLEVEEIKNGPLCACGAFGFKKFITSDINKNK
jgi:hypothetical protein